MLQQCGTLWSQPSFQYHLFCDLLLRPLLIHLTCFLSCESNQPATCRSQHELSLSASQHCGICATVDRNVFRDPLRICFFVNSGSEANDFALRLARAYTKAQDVIVLEGAYHGLTTTTTEISPLKTDAHQLPVPPYVHRVLSPDTFRGPYRRDDPNAGSKYALLVKNKLDSLASQQRRIAAFICESIQSRAGVIVLPSRYLSIVYPLVRAAGGLCIADEMQCGFGRVGSHFWGYVPLVHLQFFSLCPNSFCFHSL